MPNSQTIEPDPEIAAISAVYMALKELDPDAQGRVLNYVAGKLRISVEIEEGERPLRTQFTDDTGTIHSKKPDTGAVNNDAPSDLEGISPAARKWMTRNSLSADQLSAIFSLGVDEIDLVAKTVPGNSKRERMRSVFLLKGIAAYIGTGAPRFTHEQMKEASLHYDAFDATNFAAHLKTLASEISGDKSAGYALTTRGLTNGTELVKGMLVSK
jgi:hypothetical protein